MQINLLTFSTLFPNAAMPNHGIFVETRLRHLAAHQAVRSTVLAPVPFFPFRNKMFGRWARLARAPHTERRFGFAVHHPRYAVVPHIGMNVAPLFLYRAAFHYVQTLLRAGLAIDVIDAHYLYPDGVAAVWLAQRLGLPVVITARGSDVTLYPDYRLPRRLIKRAMECADHLIAVSAALKGRMVTLGADPDKVTILRNGVDPVLFHPLPRAHARAQLNLTRRAIVSVGHLIERKGHHRVIAALAALPDVELLIVGEGPERVPLQRLAERLSVAERVRFVGAAPQTDLPLYYSAADALVLASSHEGWANVLLEAMACGTPAVASDAEGNSEVVQDAAAGVIVRDNTAEAIAQAVAALLRDPPNRAATRAYAERFGWEAISAGQMAVFETVLTRRGRTQLKPATSRARMVSAD